MKILLLTVISVVLLSCTPPRTDEKNNTKQTNELQDSNVKRLSKISCPSTECFSFLARFMNDIDIQKKFTTYPLLFSYNDFDGMETQKISNIILEEELHFPIISYDYQRLALNYEIEIGLIENSLVKVTLYIKDGDGLTLDYYFYRKENECWKLIAVEDRSV